MTTAVEYVTRANTLMSRLQFVEAEQLFRKAVTLDSQNLGGLLGLARIALLQERADEGLALLDRIRCLRPNYAEALALTGMYWITKRQFDRAIQSLEQARAAGPALPIVHLNLGKCYSAIRQFGPAEASLREAIRLAPENCEAYNHLGYVQAETGRLNEGIHSMLRAIKIDRRYVKAYLAVGRLCERAGKADLAIRLYRSGLRYNPNAFHLLERLSSVYASRLDFRSAFTAAIRILKKRKACGDYLRVGIYAVALRKLETAEKAFQAAISMNPHSWEAHYNLAELYMSARLMDQAREHYEAAVSHNLNRYEPLNGMGLFVLMVDNDWNRAIEFLCQAQEIAPSRPEPRLNLALAYSRKGDVTAAEEYTNSVLRLCQPGDPLYRQSERLKGMLRLEIHALRKLN